MKRESRRIKEKKLDSVINWADMIQGHQLDHSWIMFYLNMGGHGGGH